MTASVALFQEQLWAHTTKGEPIIALGVHVSDDEFPEMLVMDGEGRLSWLPFALLTIDWRYSPEAARWIDYIEPEPAQIEVKPPARRRKA